MGYSQFQELHPAFALTLGLRFGTLASDVQLTQQNDWRQRALRHLLVVGRDESGGSGDGGGRRAQLWSLDLLSKHPPRDSFM